jgi:hypothetical protein
VPKPHDVFIAMLGLELVPNPDGPGYLLRPYAKTHRVRLREHCTGSVFFQGLNPTRVNWIGVLGPVEVLSIQHGIHLLYPQHTDEYPSDTILPIEEPNRPIVMFGCNFVLARAFYLRVEVRCVPELYPSEEILAIEDDAQSPPTQHSSEAETKPPTPLELGTQIRDVDLPAPKRRGEK